MQYMHLRSPNFLTWVYFWYFTSVLSLAMRMYQYLIWFCVCACFIFHALEARIRTGFYLNWLRSLYWFFGLVSSNKSMRLCRNGNICLYISFHFIGFQSFLWRFRYSLDSFGHSHPGQSMHGCICAKQTLWLSACRHACVRLWVDERVCIMHSSKHCLMKTSRQPAI